MKQEHKYTQAEIFGTFTPKETILTRLKTDEATYSKFCKLKENDKKNFLAFLSGERGLEVLLDSFFRKIFNPAEKKERMCSLLSALLGETVEDFTVMPREGDQLYEKGSIVVMDILVQLKDGRLVDVEMQKIGYRFPSQRSTCYASDLVMRQYNTLRAMHGKDFHYDMIRPVNIIVIIESTDKEFSTSPDYLHKRQVSYSSGIDLPETVNITYLTLDRFKKPVQNIIDPLDKWLAFFTYKEPNDIISLVNSYPEFLPIYHEISEFRKEPKEAISMYSEALSVLDHNTELYMIEEKRQEIKALQQEKQALLNEKQALTDEKQVLLDEKQTLSDEKQALLDEKQTLSDEKQALLDEKQTLSDEKQALLDEKQTLSDEKQALLDENERLRALLKSGGLNFDS